jgi:hypothetical protein
LAREFATERPKKRHRQARQERQDRKENGLKSVLALVANLAVIQSSADAADHLTTALLRMVNLGLSVLVWGAF